MAIDFPRKESGRGGGDRRNGHRGDRGRERVAGAAGRRAGDREPKGTLVRFYAIILQNPSCHHLVVNCCLEWILIAKIINI